LNLTDILEPRWIVLGCCMLLPFGMACVTLWIQWRNWRTRTWSETTGRIERARSVAREVSSRRFRTTGSGSSTEFVSDEDTRTRNSAEVSYSFAVGGASYHGSRICLMGEPSGSIAAILRRYPPGRVVSVYYDPDDPNRCILEREEPAKIREAWLGTAVIAAWIVAGFVVISYGTDWLRTVIVDPARAPAITMLIVLALVVILISRTISAKTRAMKKWPTTAGRIVRSEVTTSVQHHSRPNSTRRDYDVTMYHPRIVYCYEVGGNSFEGDDIGWSTSANDRAVAEKQVKRYQLQTEVRVFYNPDDPSEATLSPAGGVLALILWGIAAAIAFGAFALGWLMPR
jgi:hypothetical protein